MCAQKLGWHRFPRFCCTSGLFPSACNDTQKLTKDVKVSQAAGADIPIIHLLRCRCKTRADQVLFCFVFFPQLCGKNVHWTLKSQKAKKQFDAQGHVLIQQFCVRHTVQMANKKQCNHGESPGHETLQDGEAVG